MIAQVFPEDVIEPLDAQLAALQRKLLGRRAHWHATPAVALAACGGRAVIFSNELVDAFPVRRFQLAADGWRELAVACDAAGQVSESLLPPAPNSPFLKAMF